MTMLAKLGKAFRILLVTGVLLLVLAAFALPRIPERLAISRENTVLRRMQVWQGSLESAHREKGAFPEGRSLSVIEGIDTAEILATYGQLPAHPPPLDPFSPQGRLPLLYQTTADNWIILSAGPDRRYSLPSGMALSGETPPSSLMAHGGWLAEVAFCTFAVLWLLTGAVALERILRGDIRGHRAWMIRNFALTFGAVTLRLYLNALQAVGADFDAIYVACAWAGWVPNMLVAEWIVARLRRAAIP